MGIFDRLSTLLRSNINDLISSAENPEKMLNQILVDMRSQLAKAKQQVAAAIADEKRLRDQALPSRKAATTSPSRRSLGRGSTTSTGSSSRSRGRPTRPRRRSSRRRSVS